MRKCLSHLVLCGLLCFLPLSTYGQYAAQQVTPFQATGQSVAINEIGTGIDYHRVSWNVSGGTLSGCVLAVRGSASADMSTPSAIISVADCTSNDASSVVSGTYNYVDVSVTTFTSSGGTPVLTVTYTGYIDSPSGGAGSDSPVFTTQVDIEADGVRLTASNGTLTLTGIGDGQDECLVLDFNTTANTVDITTTCGVTTFDFSDFTLIGALTGTASGNLTSSDVSARPSGAGILYQVDNDPSNAFQVRTLAFKAKIAFEDPVATDDFFFEELANTITITSIYCKTLVGTVDLDVTVGGSDVNGTDITCNTSGVLDSSLAGDTAGAVGEELALAVASVASSPTYLMVQVNGTIDD